MAITDIISEEEISTPNMEIAQGGPEDFMTEDEMDPYQDPELQQLLDSLPGEQAEVLMQLIKEFKAMVAQGFQGEFEDFVKMKMASAQGGPEDFMSEEEMQIGPEEQQAILPMGQQVAQGGRIGYDQGGGIMDVVEQEQVETSPTTQQLIMKWLNDRGLPITPENIQRAIMEMSREGQAPAMTRGQMDMPQMEMPRPPSGEGYVPQEFIGQDITETVTPDVASIKMQTDEVVPPAKPEDAVFSDQEMRDMKQKYIEQGGTLDKASWGIEDDVEDAGVMQTTDPTFYSDEIIYTDDDAIQWRQQLDTIREARRGLSPDSYLQLEDRKMKEGVDKGFISEEDYLNKWQMPFFGRRGENITNRIDNYRNWAFGDDYAQGGRIGYQYGNQVTADSPGIMSQVPDARVQQIEQARLFQEAEDKIMQKFYEKFPGIDGSGMRIEDMVAELQAEGVGQHARNPQTGEVDILSFAAGLDMITPESVRKSTQKIMGGDTQWGDMSSEDEFYHPEYEHQFDHPVDEMRRQAYGIYQDYLEHQFDHPVDEMRGRIGYQGGGITDLRQAYGMGDIVKSVFKGAKSAVKGITKSIKKFVKSDLGKMALMYMATAGMGNILQPGAASWASPFTKGAGTGWLRPGTILSNYGNLFKGSPEVSKAAGKLTNQYSPIANMGYNANLSTLAKGKEIADKSGLFSKALGSFKTNPMPWILGTSGLAGLYTAANPGEDNLDNLMGNYKGEVKEWDDMLADIRSGKNSTAFSTANTDFTYPYYYQLAEGGRVGRAEGGLMDLGGLEKDYRAEGGFVPIGKKEKADDVPARLSVNEFVFTADAVRNAGGGDVDRGAEVMENVMTNLEQGGSISEESQGLEGARDMFEVSERLSEVV
jgi:hypothetical protein